MAIRKPAKTLPKRKPVFFIIFHRFSVEFCTFFVNIYMFLVCFFVPCANVADVSPCRAFKTSCWWLGLVIYLISKVPRGQSCWRPGLADVPYYYFTMPRGQTCWKLGLCWCTLLLFYHAHRPDFLADEKHLQNNTVANTKTKKLGKSHLKRVNLENSMSTHIWTWTGTGRTSTSQTLL